MKYVLFEKKDKFIEDLFNEPFSYHHLIMVFRKKYHNNAYGKRIKIFKTFLNK